MPIEAELKARVTDVERVRQGLAEFAPGEQAVYRDTYYDRPDGSLALNGEELRLRSIETAARSRNVLTYKTMPTGLDTSSKVEHETEVTDRESTDEIILGLGHEVVIRFSKYCENHRFVAAGYGMLATLVTVPEIAGTFLEIETLVSDPADVPAALAAIRTVLADLGVGPDRLTDELYTDAVAAAQSTNGHFTKE
jgi:adenylate cyclase class 2